MAGIGGKLKKWDACDEQLKSFAHMAVAAQVGCSLCLDFNYFEANNLHLDMDKAREVPRWRESAVFSALERQVLEYAEAITVTPPSVSDEMVARLREQLGDAALVELSAVIALRDDPRGGHAVLAADTARHSVTPTVTALHPRRQAAG
jgi:alkylhydroperoxidase family enzyme